MESHRSAHDNRNSQDVYKRQGVRRRYLIGGQLDSVMNYPFKEAILNYVKYADAKAFTDSIMTILDHYPKPAIDMLMNFLSTHDTERALTRLAGDEIGWNGKDWQAERYLNGQQYMYGISLMKCAMVLQFFLSLIHIFQFKRYKRSSK